ncbi:MAG: hypothetical protein KDA25_08585 [Phycisphaerales bacterium]|nr:hypothetical protein [Phycisphaerales bacterium]
MGTINATTGARFCIGIALAVGGSLLATAPAAAQDAADPQVEVTDYGVVEALSVKDTDLAEVLQMLSIQSQKNIITSKNVSGTVTANLFDVTFYEALDAILRANGYGYIEEGNFVYVYTLSELEEIEKAKRKAVTRIFELDHVSAGDALEFITPLLSDVGKASARGDVPEGFKPDISSGGADGYAFSAKVVVNDYAENVESIASLLDDIDTPPQQVLVEASILQTTLDESAAFGVDFSIIGNFNFTDLSNPLSAVNDLLGGSAVGGFQPPEGRGRGVSSRPGNTEGPGTLKVGIIHDNVAAFLRVLDEVTDTTVLARPKIMALNRQRAQVLVGARVGYLSTTATETTTTQTVEFLDTGIQLVFRPFISRDGSIRMEIAPSVSEASLRTVTDANSAVVTIPDELTNEITTNVRLKDGETLVLGGLFRESTSITRRQVPLLGDIPIIGAAFRGQDDKVDRDEIIFLITPNIIKDSVLAGIGRASEDYIETVRVGARSGLLPFGRSSMTTHYNQEAIAALNRGDTAKALYHVNNSLRLIENQPEMIRFRDRLTGVDQAKITERVILDRIIRNALDGDAAATTSMVPPTRDSLTAVVVAADIPWFNTDDEPVDELDTPAETDPTMTAADPVDDLAASDPEPVAADVEVTPADPIAAVVDIEEPDPANADLTPAMIVAQWQATHGNPAFGGWLGRALTVWASRRANANQSPAMNRSGLFGQTTEVVEVVEDPADINEQ